jgi:hypothetical protein
MRVAMKQWCRKSESVFHMIEYNCEKEPILYKLIYTKIILKCMAKYNLVICIINLTLLLFWKLHEAKFYDTYAFLSMDHRSPPYWRKLSKHFEVIRDRVSNTSQGFAEPRDLDKMGSSDVDAGED